MAGDFGEQKTAALDLQRLLVVGQGTISATGCHS
jgi:hypothetical protein